MLSDKKYCDVTVYLELKCQGHMKNQKPMPREQIICHKNGQGLA